MASYYLRDTFFNTFYKFIQNPSTVSVETMKRMIDTDDTVGSGVDFLAACLCARMGTYQHPNKEITAFVTRSLNNIEGGFYDTMKEMQSMPILGGEKDIFLKNQSASAGGVEGWRELKKCIGLGSIFF